MNKPVWAMALASAVLAGTIAVRAQDAPQDSPTTEPVRHATSRPSGIRLVEPYGDIASLSEDEKAQIAAIHKKANEDVKAIHEKEDDDIRGLLTDEQKAELDKLIAQKRERAQERAKEKKAAATQAAAG
jgi:Spy/CpxP family protein refolding chaperone